MMRSSMSIILIGKGNFEENTNSLVLNPDSDSIGVTEIREAIRFLSLGKGKTLIIKSAERLTEQAQNGLLKTLEEPPQGAEIILETTNEDLLLETVRSRCQIVHSSSKNTEVEESATQLLKDIPKLSINDRLMSAKEQSVKRDKAEEMLNRLLTAVDPTRENPKNIRALFKAKKYLKANCNTRLVIENLFLNW